MATIRDLASAKAAIHTLVAAFFMYHRGLTALGAEVTMKRWQDRPRQLPYLQLGLDAVAVLHPKIFGQHVRQTIRQTEHAVGTKTQRAPAANAAQLRDHFLEPLGRADG